MRAYPNGMRTLALLALLAAPCRAADGPEILRELGSLYARRDAVAAERAQLREREARIRIERAEAELQAAMLRRRAESAQGSARERLLVRADEIVFDAEQKAVRARRDLRAGAEAREADLNSLSARIQALVDDFWNTPFAKRQRAKWDAKVKSHPEGWKDGLSGVLTYYARLQHVIGN